jgi:hypothetical protein
MLQSTDEVVDQHPHPRPAEPAGQPGGVVEVAMAADDRLDADRILAQAAQVAGAPRRAWLI